MSYIQDLTLSAEVIDKIQFGGLLTYCAAEFCEGLPLDADYEKIEGDVECPVCYVSLNSGKISKLNKCSHMFCLNCVEEWDHKKGCPMCRQMFEETLTLNMPVHCSIKNWKIIGNEHRHCLLNFFPIMKEYAAYLNAEWKQLIEFMVKSQVYKCNYVGILGIEHLRLDKYKDEGTLLKLGGSYAIIKEQNDTTKVVVSCLLPCMSIRLVILPNDDSDFGQDNEYADEAVGYMNEQLKVCWRVFARLLNKKSIDNMLVRKFKNVTCYLLLTGFRDCSICNHHYVPMKEQLQNLKKCNFTYTFFDEIRASIFPLCDLAQCHPPRDYDVYDCCKNHEVANNNANEDSDEEVDEGDGQPQEPDEADEDDDDDDDDDDSEESDNSEEE